MLGDSRRPVFYRKKNERSPYMGIDGVHKIKPHPAEYANTESIWVNKENLILSCVSVHVNDCFFKGKDAFWWENISPVANGNKILEKSLENKEKAQKEKNQIHRTKTSF